MTQLIRKKCNGANKHDNDFSLADIIRQTPLVRTASAQKSSIPEQVVLRCRVCTEGRVVFTRSDLERVLQS